MDTGYVITTISGDRISITCDELVKVNQAVKEWVKVGGAEVKVSCIEGKYPSGSEPALPKPRKKRNPGRPPKGVNTSETIVNYLFSLASGDLIEISEADHEAFHACMRPVFKTSYGLQITKAHVHVIYEPRKSPSIAKIRMTGRMFSSLRSQAGTKGKHTIIERYGQEAAESMVGKGVALPDRHDKDGNPTPVAFNRHKKCSTD